MTIFDLKEYFKNTEEPKFFLKKYFSWGGNYSEIAFTPSTHGSKEDTLSLLEESTRMTFKGFKECKACDYEYDDDTPVHFEFYEKDIDVNALYEVLLNFKFNA